MSNEMLTDLPSVTSATLSDLIYAVQADISVQESLSQLLTLFLANIIFSYPGDPNGNLAGTTYALCYDSVNSNLYVCTTTGSSLTAVWTLVLPSLVLPANGGTGVSSPTAHTLPIAEGSSAFNFLGPLTNGQVLIGSTGADPVPSTLTAGTGTSITNAAGAITISSIGGGLSWTVVTGATQTIVVNNGYIANNAGLVTLTLPSVSSIGDVISIVGEGAGGWTIAQGSGQQIRIGSSASTVGAGGSISSSNRYDTIKLLCIVANTIWISVGAPQGNIVLV